MRFMNILLRSWKIVRVTDDTKQKVRESDITEELKEYQSYG